LPKDFAREIPGHAVKTVPQAGWASVKNGELLRLIADSGKFEAFLTVDKNLPRQQKIQELPFAVVVLLAKSNRLDDVVPFAPELLRRLPSFSLDAFMFFPLLLLLPSDQNDSEASFVSHHASVSFCRICQGNGFDHGADLLQGQESVSSASTG